MRYETPAAFRDALLARLRRQAETQGVSVERLRKRVVFERLLARLIQVASGRWALKGALALDFRLPVRARATKDADLVTEADVEQLTDDLVAATRVDLGDHFVFRTGRVRDVDGEQPEPTVRFHVTVEVAGRLFDEATLDVAVNADPEWQPQIVTSHLLGFADLPPVEIPVIPPEVHVAEKTHAYTRLYGAGAEPSTRSKDLVDLIVIVETTALLAAELRAALERVFKGRGTHPLPATLPSPPGDWAVPYRTLAGEIGIESDLQGGYREVAVCLNPILSGEARGRWNPAERRWAVG